MKRIFDIVISLAAMIVFAPLMILAAIAIKLDTKGPVVYRQTRIGQNQKQFGIFKFRSMVTNADQIGGFSTQVGDARITRVGRILRKTSIDELPQLLNVLIGDMSLVGPRPDVPAQEQNYTAAQWIKRHKVRPGITGLAQATMRSAATPEERTRLDLEYVDTAHWMTDLKLLWLTAKKIIGGSGTV